MDAGLAELADALDELAQFLADNGERSRAWSLADALRHAAPG